MKENSSVEIEQALYEAERRGRDMENLDREMDKIGEKDEELNKFVKEKSESLPPHSKELIDLYAPLAQEYERQMNRDQYYGDKEALVIAAKNLNDFIFQAGEKLTRFFTYEKYEPFMERFINLKEQARAIQADAEELPDDSKKAKSNKKIDLLSQNIGYQYQNLVKLTKDMYQESLISKEDKDSISLPGQIMEKIEKGES